MSRMRSIRGIYLEIKLADPETVVTEHLIRQLVTEGYIPSIKSGNKYIVDLDAALEYLYKSNQ